MGFTFAAFMAGNKPANTPATIKIIVAVTTTDRLTDGLLNAGVSIIGPIAAKIIQANNKPTNPEMAVIKTDSKRTRFTICLGLAPNAFLTPISFVRSLIVNTMMFPMPTIPAIKIKNPTPIPIPLRTAVKLLISLNASA